MSYPTVTPTLTVHANYVSGDFVGTSSAAMQFTLAGDASNAAGGGYILGCMLIDRALASVAGELWLFDSAVTPPNDSAAWSISDADAATCVAVIPFSTYYASALNSVAFGVPDGNARFEVPASGILYGCFVTRGAPTYASGDLTFKLTILQA